MRSSMRKGLKEINSPANNHKNDPKIHACNHIHVNWVQRPFPFTVYRPTQNPLPKANHKLLRGRLIKQPQLRSR